MDAKQLGEKYRPFLSSDKYMSTEDAINIFKEHGEDIKRIIDSERGVDVSHPQGFSNYYPKASDSIVDLLELVRNAKGGNEATRKEWEKHLPTDQEIDKMLLARALRTGMFSAVGSDHPDAYRISDRHSSYGASPIDIHETDPALFKEWVKNRIQHETSSGYSEYGNPIFEMSLGNVKRSRDDYFTKKGAEKQEEVLNQILDIANEHLNQNPDKPMGDYALRELLNMYSNHHFMSPQTREKILDVVSKNKAYPSVPAALRQINEGAPTRTILSNILNKDSRTAIWVDEDGSNHYLEPEESNAILDALIKKRPDAIKEIASRPDLFEGRAPAISYLGRVDLHRGGEALKKITKHLTGLSEADRQKYANVASSVFDSIVQKATPNKKAEKVKERMVEEFIKDNLTSDKRPLVSWDILSNAALYPHLKPLMDEHGENYKKAYFEKMTDRLSKVKPEEVGGTTLEDYKELSEMAEKDPVSGSPQYDPDKKLDAMHRGYINAMEKALETRQDLFDEISYAGNGHHLPAIMKNSLFQRALMKGDRDKTLRAISTLDALNMEPFFHDMKHGRSFPTEGHEASVRAMEHQGGMDAFFNLINQEGIDSFSSGFRQLFKGLQKHYGAMQGKFFPDDNQAVRVDPEFQKSGYQEMKVKLGSTGLRRLRALAEQAAQKGIKLVTSKLSNKLNPFRKTIENERTVDDWSQFGLEGEQGHLDINKLEAYRNYIATTPQGRSIAPKIDRLVDHMLKTGTTEIEKFPPELRSSPVKRKEKTAQVAVDWEPLSTGGVLDPKKLEQRINEIPDTPINYFTGRFVLGMQQHMTGNQDQFTIGVHKDQLKRIREEGLEKFYDKIKQHTPVEMHPQDENGLGWVRSHSDHDVAPEVAVINRKRSFIKGNSVKNLDPQALWEHHQDEVQADYDTAVTEFFKANQYLSDDQVKEHMDGFKKLRGILYHGLEPGQVVHEAWQQHMRNQGRIGDTYSVWSHKSKGKMKLAGMKRLDKPPPVDFFVNYGEVPESMGATPSKYGDISAQGEGTLIGEPTWNGKIDKSEKLYKAEDGSLAHLFHNADDEAIEQHFHRNPSRKVVESTFDELLGTPEGKMSLAAYLDRAATENHGHSVMQHLAGFGGSYFIKALQDEYQRLTGKNLAVHVGKHLLPNVAHKEHVPGLDGVLEHVLAHAPSEELDPMLSSLRGAPSVKNTALLGGLINSVYHGNPAQMFSDLNVDPEAVSKLPYKAQLGYVIHEMIKNAPEYGNKPSLARQIASELKKNPKFKEDLKTYADYHGIDSESNKLYRSIVEGNGSSELQLSVKHGSAALRKLRDYLKENGDKLPDELPKGQRWNTLTKEIKGRDGSINYVLDYNPLRSRNGKLTAESVQRYIDSMQPVTYDFETGPYEGGIPKKSFEEFKQFVSPGDLQRMGRSQHSKDPQTVLRIKLSKGDIKKLEATGADKTLAALVDIGKQSGHPVSDGTIGWVRFSRGDDGNVFVDEAQSDFDTNFEALLRSQLKQMYPNLSEEKLQENVDHFNEHKLPKAHIEQIKQMAFGNRPAVEVLHEAFQQYGRNKGWDGSTWQTHTSKSKAPISLDLDKPMPPKFKENYEDTPKALGAVPAKYGTLDATKNPDHPHLAGADVWEEKLRQSEKDTEVL